MSKEEALKALSVFWKGMEPVRSWAKGNVTFSLILAILTEVPRWVFAFEAVNEPLWAGIPLAVLIAFATAHAWEEFFTYHDNLLLGLNIVSLIFAVFTISPVLFAMIKTGEDVSIYNVFPYVLQWAWAVVLACTTFLPLVQLAVVESKRRERAILEPTVAAMPDLSWITDEFQKLRDLIPAIPEMPAVDLSPFQNQISDMQQALLVIQKWIDEEKERYSPIDLFSRMDEKSRSAILELLEIITSGEVRTVADVAGSATIGKSKAYETFRLAEVCGIIYKNGDGCYHSAISAN